MARMTKAEKALEREYDRLFRLHGNCIQFDIMDLGKMHAETLSAARNGGNMEDAIKEVIAKYRKN